MITNRGGLGFLLVWGKVYSMAQRCNKFRPIEGRLGNEADSFVGLVLIKK